MNVTIILVGTTHPGNIGATARAMKNMGLNELILVNPKSFPYPEASARASGAEEILRNATIFDNLSDAIKDFTYVVEALDSNGCESREEILVLVDTCATGMHSEMFSKVNVYPNPTSDKIYIDLPTNEIFTISFQLILAR